MSTERQGKQVSEQERAAIEDKLLQQAAAEKPLADGAGGNSPYSPQTVVYGPEEARERGARIALTPVCWSHDGAGKYKGRGRTREVWAAAAHMAGQWATCHATDRDAEQVGESGFYVRPWAVEEQERSTDGMGADGQTALAAALDEVGLTSTGMAEQTAPLVVTRHPALVEHLQEQGLAPENAEVVEHATEEQVEGRHVIGVLPLPLAALADRVTVVPLQVPQQLRGQELSLEQVRQYAEPARTYRVQEKG